MQCPSHNLCHVIGFDESTLHILFVQPWIDCVSTSNPFSFTQHTTVYLCVCVSSIIYMSCRWCGPRYHQLVLHSKWYKFNLNKLIVNTMMKIHFLFSRFSYFSIRCFVDAAAAAVMHREKKRVYLCAYCSYIHWSKWFDATFWHLFSCLYRFGRRSQYLRISNAQSKSIQLNTYTRLGGLSRWAENI